MRTATNEPFFYTTVEGTQSNVRQLSWEAVFDEEVAISRSTVPQAQGEDTFEIRCRDVEDQPDEWRIGDEAKAAMKHLSAKNFTTVVEEPLDNIPGKPDYNPKNKIPSVANNVVEHVTLDSLLKEVTTDTLEAHKAKYFDTDTAFDRTLKRLLVSDSLMAPITTF